MQEVMGNLELKKKKSWKEEPEKNAIAVWLSTVDDPFERAEILSDMTNAALE